MKYLKMLGLFAVTAVAMMGFAGSVSAALTTAPVYTGEIDASAESSLLLKAGLEATCTESTVKAEITSNTTNLASGPISALSFSGCNGTVHTLNVGSLTIAGDELFAIGSNVTVERFGITCTYGGGDITKIGTLTNTGSPGNDTVTLDVNANLPKQAGSVFCSATGVWSGSYILTNPHPSFLDFDDDHVGASFTSPTGTVYTGDFDATAESSLLLKAGMEVTCTGSTVKGIITSNTTHHASGPLSALAFSGCNGKVESLPGLGSLTITGDELIAIGSKVTVERFGIFCTYGGGEGTKVGTLTNTTLNGKDAVTLDVNANLPKQAGGAFCASTGVWTGSYIITTPVENYLDVT
jgi:hypothetical protein